MMYATDNCFSLYCDEGVKIDRYYNDSLAGWDHSDKAVFTLRKEPGEYGYSYWIACVYDGIEVRRDNIRFCSAIDWNKEDMQKLSEKMITNKKEYDSLCFDF